MNPKKTEAETRQDIIDKKLLKLGWNMDAPSQVTAELDTWVGLPEEWFSYKHILYRELIA